MFLNPYRFQGSTVGKPMSANGTSSATFGGASIVSGAVASDGETAFVVGSDQLGSGDASMAGEATMTMEGAAIASAVASMAGEATLTAHLEQPEITVDAADFDGTNDYARRVAGLTGAADSKSGIFSAWVQFDTALGAPGNTLFAGLTSLAGVISRFRVSRVNDGTLQVLGSTSAGAPTLLIATAATFGASATWFHLLVAWDLNAAAAHIYINDVSDIVTTTNNNNAIDLTLADWALGAFGEGSSKLDGGLAELYFAPGQYLDFSAESNRRKFISAGGKPVDLGATGSNPTGTAPLVYMHLDNAETANNFAINRGTGGNFTVTGALATDSSSPSD
jgi:hypothetical protein